MGLDTGDRGGVGGGVGGPSMSQSKVVMFMLGLHMRAGFVLSMVTDGEAETSELQLAKRLVNDRGRDLVFILPGSLGKYDIKLSLLGRKSFPTVQSGETDHDSESSVPL